jgi:tRNA dimethylallyltransferase
MAKSKPPLALIAGPTASGKSALALALAERAGGVIVNADSAQVDRDLPVLSAAPGEVERKRIEHRLYGFLDAAEICSAADWAGRAKAGVADIQQSNRLPILVGGTGLYLRTLIEGIAPVPAIDPEVRAGIREAPVEQNHERLRSLDPAAAERLHHADTARVARALEVLVSTGRTLAEWQKERVGGIGEGIELRPLVLLPPRDWLYDRCDRRFAQMVEEGAIEEAQALLARGLNPNLPAMRAIGVREIGAHLRGECTRGEMIAAGQQATRRYAKRQYTWFSNQPPPDWPRFREALDSARLGEPLALLGPKG